MTISSSGGFLNMGRTLKTYKQNIRENNRYSTHYSILCSMKLKSDKDRICTIQQRANISK